MNSPLPASQWGYDASLKPYTYDGTKAKALLKAAGVKLPMNVELLTYNTPRGYNPAGADLAVALQSYFKKIGINARVRKLDMGAFLAQTRSGKYHGLFVTGFSGDNGDPDNFVGTLFNSKYMPVGDTSHYNSPQANALMDKAVEVSDVAQRTAMYRKVQAIIMHDAPWVFVNSTLQVRAAGTSVQGFRLNPTQMFFDMDQVSLAK
jgi:ABC-type transport system substrate-binding protein